MTRVGFFSIFVCCPTSGQTFQVSKTWKVYQPKYGFNTKGIIMRPTQKPAGKGEKHPGKIAEKRQPVFSNPCMMPWIRLQPCVPGSMLPVQQLPQRTSRTVLLPGDPQLCGHISMPYGRDPRERYCHPLVGCREYKHPLYRTDAPAQ